jgi:hypothetical protein
MIFDNRIGERALQPTRAWATSNAKAGITVMVMDTPGRKADNMTVRELIHTLMECNLDKTVILNDGETMHDVRVYVWDESTDNPTDSPVELQADI